MRLYGITPSPFVQRCLLAARAKGHDIDLAPLPGGSVQAPEFQAISPMGRVPLLELDDGSYLSESGAIASYLDEVLDGPALLPADAIGRARVREVEWLAVCELGGALRPVMISRVIGIPGTEPLFAPAIAQLDKGCGALARLMDGKAFAAGERFTLADCVAVPLVNFAMIFSYLPEIDAVMKKHDVLRSYHAGMTQDPAAARTIAEMNEGFAAIRARAAAMQDDDKA
jgi:glutathione S-transferase